MTKCRTLLLAAACVVAAVVAGGLLCLRRFPSRLAPVDGGNFRCRVMTVSGGYGYVVTLAPSGDTLIVQPYIPVVGGHSPFGTKDAALKAGLLVCRKLSQGELPTVTREEVEKIITEGHDSVPLHY